MLKVKTPLPILTDLAGNPEIPRERLEAALGWALDFISDIESGIRYDLTGAEDETHLEGAASGTLQMIQVILFGEDAETEVANV
jgi:hypothetical protein